MQRGRNYYDGPRFHGAAILRDLGHVDIQQRRLYGDDFLGAQHADQFLGRPERTLRAD